MKAKRVVIDWNFFTSLVIILSIILISVWVLLKIAGVIHSPIWVDMIPYLGIIASGIAVFYKLGKIMKGIEVMAEKVNRISTLEDKLTSIDNRLSILEHDHKLILDGKIKVHSL